MKLYSLFGLAAAVLLLAGCSSTPTKVDTGAIHARTFSFVNRRQQPEPGFADERQAAHDMIQAAITKDLAARGVTRVAAGGDVTVGYLVILGNNASTESINTYFGYGQDSSGLHDIAHEAYTGGKNPNYFEAGTLLIDIVDTKTYKLLKRNYATRSIIHNLAPETQAERIQEAVDEIFRGLRIAQ
jgi:outer membrane murein-binding lipoprotein Lpp